ncbi:hypothetical protein SISNIDRAFT_485616 [Sistotremastrum niveocremeum HHB9708]|uniref:Uncharacterized protein n=1 Tax=Sistotremastrum niveocremeum HHB9708 TaxID=1314777 RepID=A0A164UM34_9AGAM|nr:hypothetical protein SISNIDRAFT_485616 [Sistotremastrum niveocremeum HHB9708]
MSWGLGDDRGEAQLSEIRKQLSKKGQLQHLEITSLTQNVYKLTESLALSKESQKEACSKLDAETNRATKLEADLARKTEDHRRELLHRQNVELELTAAREQIKQGQRDFKRLETQLEDDMRNSSSSNTEQQKISKEKATMEARIRELESALAKAESRNDSQPAMLSPPTPATQRSARPRSSSLSGLKSKMEQDTKHMRAMEDSAKLLEDKLAKVQIEVNKMANEKLALEKKHSQDLEEYKNALSEAQDEVKYWRSLESQDPLKSATEQDSGDQIEQERLRQKIAEQELLITQLRIQIEEYVESKSKAVESSQGTPETDDGVLPVSTDADLHRDFAILSEKLVAEQQCVRDLRSQISSLAAAISLHEQEKMGLLSQNTVYQETISTLKAESLQYLTLRAELHNSNIARKEADEAVSSLSAQFTELSGMETERNRMAESLEQANLELSALRTALLEAEQETFSLRSRQSTLQTQAELQLDKIKSLEAQVAQLCSDLETSKMEGQEIIDLHNQTIKSLDMSKARVAELESDVADRSTLSEAERRNMDLIDANMTIRALEDEARRSQGTSSPFFDTDPFCVPLAGPSHEVQPPEQERTRAVEKLMLMIQRLRAERDELRQELDFVQMEYSFAQKAEPESALDAQDDHSLSRSSSAAVEDPSLVSRKEKTFDVLALVTEWRARHSETLDRENQLSAHEHDERLACIQRQLEQDRAQNAAQICALQAVVQGLEERHSRITSEATLSAQQRDLLQTTIEALENDLNQMRQRLVDKECEVQRLLRCHPSPTLPSTESHDQTHTTAPDSHHQGYLAKIQRREEQIALHQNEIRRLETNAKIAEETIIELEGEREKLLSSLHQREDLSAQIAEQDSLHSLDLASTIEIIFSSISTSRDLQVRLRTQCSKLRALEQERDASQNEQLKAASLLREAQHRLQCQEANIAEMQGQIAQAESTYSAAQQRVQDLTHQLSKVTDLGTERTDKLQEVLQRVSSLERDLESSQASEEAQRNALETATQNIDRLTVAKKASEADISSLSLKICELEEKISEQIGQMARKSAEHTQASEEFATVLRETNSRLASSQEDLRRSQEELSITEKRVEDLQAGMLKVQALADQKESELQDIRTLQESEKLHLERLRQENATSVGQLKASMKQLQATHSEELVQLQEELMSAQDFLREQEAEAKGLRLDQQRMKELRVALQLAQEEGQALTAKLAEVSDARQEYQKKLAHSEKQASDTSSKLIALEAESSLRLRRYEQQEQMLHELKGENALLTERLTAINKETEELTDANLSLLKSTKKQAAKIADLTRKLAKLQGGKRSDVEPIAPTAAFSVAPESTATPPLPSRSSTLNSTTRAVVGQRLSRPGTPEQGSSRIPAPRTPDLPSRTSIFKPKTPEVPPIRSVFKLKSPAKIEEPVFVPQPRADPVEPVSAPSPGSLKRPRPDDFEVTGRMPPQPVLSTSPHRPLARRVLQGVRGFTPTRASRTGVSATAGEKVASPFAFSNLANSPRAITTPAPSKKGSSWLGKMRGPESKVAQENLEP